MGVTEDNLLSIEVNKVKRSGSGELLIELKIWRYVVGQMHFTMLNLD